MRRTSWALALRRPETISPAAGVPCAADQGDAAGHWSGSHPGGAKGKTLGRQDDNCVVAEFIDHCLAGRVDVMASRKVGRETPAQKSLSILS
jgi:hypothetical protein